jgi:hypothetical protein
MDPRAWIDSPLALAVLWLPAATLLGFAVLDLLSIVRFGTAVLGVTLGAALGWVTVGFGGSRVDGPLETAARPTHADEQGTDPELSTFAGVLTYLTVTTAVGWAIFLVTEI